MAERVLVLGTTGIKKSFAIESLKKFQEKNYREVNFISFDVEDKVLENNDLEMFDYLDADEDFQCRAWLNGWNELKNSLDNPNYKDKHILLSMHGTLARQMYGVRSPIKIKRIVDDFKPTKVITLIGDVYLKWHFTQEYAGETEYKGKPTLEQLLQARRTEIFLGDFIAKQVDSECFVSPPHYVIGIWHPARVLDKVLFRNPKTGYLSFPISKPRDRLNIKKDSKGVDEVNEMLTILSKNEAREAGMVFFCPLTIDEIPLLERSQKKRK